MTDSFNSPETAYYFERFGFCPKQIAEPPQANLGMVIVIPAYNEPDLLLALDALRKADRPSCSVEVILVINSKEGECPEIVAANALGFDRAREFAARIEEPSFHIHVLHCPDLPRKRAGVGLARKIGMDEALRRLDQIRSPQGVIVCFDADCICDLNYLGEIERFFFHPEMIGCSIYFEHPLEGRHDPEIYQGITLYELHLRYYVEGLRFARFPYAFHTIGSSMAVRADVYRKQGGMNKRQAGEDFYFLHKIIPLGGFGDLTTTRVIASPRASGRVPFGTGRAVGDFLQGKELLTYNHQSFLDLKVLFEKIEMIYSARTVGALPASLTAFLQSEGFEKVLPGTFENSSSFAAFQKRFFQWFDGFQIMKFLHFSREHFHANRPVAKEAATLWPLISEAKTSRRSAALLLEYYRNFEKSNPRFFPSSAGRDSFCKTGFKS